MYALPPGASLRVGLIGSVDGRAAVDGLSAGLGGPPDRQVFRALRALADVVLVGAGTARAEGYRPVRVGPATTASRRGRGQPPVPPVAVVSRTGRLDGAPDLLAAGAGTLLLVPDDGVAPAARALPHVEVVGCGPTGEVDLARVLAALHARGLRRVLCEGGPQLAGALLAAGLVDELCLTTGPLVVGGGPGLLAADPPQRRPARLASLLEGDGFLLARWVLPPS